jgi:hypothetical protein
MDAVTALQVEQPTIDEPTPTTPVVDETSPMEGSKCAACVDDDKAKLPKKQLSREEKSIQDAKRRNWRADLKQKLRQQAADEARMRFHLVLGAKINQERSHS